MSKLTYEETVTLQPIVAQVAITLKRRYTLLDREDLLQEAWVWVLSHTKQVRELLELEDEKESGRLLAYRISLGTRKWAEKEKAALLGYEPEDVYFYTNPELAVLVREMLDPEAWTGGPTSQSDGPGNRQDPAVGGNWVATLSDVARAYRRLPDDDRELLRMHYGEQLTLREMGEYLEISHMTAGRHVATALEHLHEALGGDRPDGPAAEYTGSRRHRSNAEMNATIRSYE